MQESIKEMLRSVRDYSEFKADFARQNSLFFFGKLEKADRLIKFSKYALKK